MKIISTSGVSHTLKTSSITSFGSEHQIMVCVTQACKFILQKSFSQ